MATLDARCVEMLKHDIELGCSLFTHRKSHIHLLTKVATTILCKNADHHASLSDEMLQPCRLWLPRARTFRLSLQLRFADDVDLTPTLSQDVDSIITDLIESAELWAQLGYEASQVECQRLERREGERSLQVDFELQSQRDIDTQSWCPAGTVSWDLQSVNLSLRFTGDRRIDADPRDWTSKMVQEQVFCHLHRFGSGDPFGKSQSSSVTEDELADFQRQAGPAANHTPVYFQLSDRVHLKQRPTERTLLDEDVFSALLDAGFRTSICPKPIRLGAGVKCLIDQDGYHLCDLAPTSFALNYLQRLKEQAQFIPGISRLLQKFVNCASSSESRSDPSHQGPDSNEIRDQAPEGLQTHMWHLLRNRVRNHESARRLCPLKCSNKVRLLSDSMLVFPHVFCQSSEVEPQDEACLQSEFGSCEAIGEDDLLDFRLDLDLQANIPWNAIPVVTAEAIDGDDRRPREGLHDGSGGQGMVEIYGCPFEGEAGPGPPQHESRKYSRSVSQMSDVSMLLPCERPMRDCRTIGQPQAIGGTSWLTQNVIRMHPLRQQQHQHDEVDRQNSARERHSLYERPNLGWWSDTSDASDLPLEESFEQYTKSHLDACLFSLCPSEKERVHDYLDFQRDLGEESTIATVSPMSTRQSREGSSGSLAEVIGNDHLLWHMWKRRASVAPRGEEDITDMKTLFATDPDMKLFSSRWDLDPSDISSSSNEDPMLQETTYNQSPRDKANSPMTPNSERRSYFGPARSSSASGYVGRSNADPKRRSSLIKRFTWGGRQNTPQAPGLDGSKLDQRTVEVKRRKTMDDYEMMDREATNDDSSDMLF